MATRTISVTIVGNADSVMYAFAKAGGAGQHFGRQMTTSARTAERQSGRIKRAFGKLDAKSLFSGFAGGAGFMATGAAFGGITHLIESSVEGATSLQKSGHTIDQVFGKAGESVKKFAEKDASKLGISAQTAQDAAVKFGILFGNIGVGKKRAAEMTISMLKLAGVMGIIKGGGTGGIIDMFPLAMAGATRGLKSMGIVATPDMIKAEEKTLGVGNDPKGKAMAIYAIALRNLGIREQQAAQHMKDLRTQQMLLGAEWSNTKDKIGKIAIPALSKLDAALLHVLGNTFKIREAWGHLFGKDGEKNREKASKAALTWLAKPVTGPLHEIGKAAGNIGGLFGDVFGSGKGSGKQRYLPGRGPGQKGVHIENAHFNGVQNMQQLIAELNRFAKNNTSQSRGRTPGVRTGLA